MKIDKKNIMEIINLSVPAICIGLIPLVPLIFYFWNGGK